MGGRHSNIRLGNLFELQQFGQRLIRSLHQQDDADFAHGAIALAWTFGGKVPLKTYTESGLDPGFSKAFVGALDSWFDLSMIEDIDMSIATSWRTIGFEPFVQSGFAQNLIAGNLDRPVTIANSHGSNPMRLEDNESEPDEDADVVTQLGDHQRENRSTESDSSLSSTEEDVIEDNANEHELPLADAALGTTFTDTESAFYCRLEETSCPLYIGC